MGVTWDLQRTWAGEESSANDFIKFCYFEINEFYLLYLFCNRYPLGGLSLRR